MAFEIKHGDCLEVLRTLADESVQCCVTSPPYWGLRDYGVAGQLGLERTPEEYVSKMVEVFREVRRVLRKDGTLWLNLGDSYSGSWARSSNPGGKGDSSRMQVSNVGSYVGESSASIVPPGMKPKDLCGIPWMVAFALRSDGWYLRQDIIWSKPNPMPESVRDRCTKAHEYIFLLSKSERYYYDQDAIREPWTCDRDDMREKGVRTGLAYLQQGENGYSNSVKALPRSYNGSSFNKGKSAAAREHMAAIGDGEREDNPLGRNKRSVWNLTTKPFPEAHFATFPPEIPEICIKAGTKEGDTVLDPFNGAGTTGLVATRLMRNYIGIELNEQYVEMANRRIVSDAPLFNRVEL